MKRHLWKARCARTMRRLVAEALEARLAMDASGLPNTTAELDILPPISYFVPTGSAPVSSGTSGPALASIPVSLVPAYSSLPGAVDTLYLDFNGHFEATWGSYSNLTTPAYSIDTDFTTFSDQEQANITSIWAQVAEDYAPFNINVTTVEPASFANGVGLRVAIGGSSSDWLGSAAGGVGYIDSYTNSIVNTVYVFPAQLANGTAKYVGEASSHEAGHAFGLQHQSLYDATGTLVASYYSGANGIAPIMGNSYSATRGLWWRGTSTSATTIQDDMSVISRSTNTFGYRPDDYGNTASTAVAFPQTGAQVQATGVITQTTDVDAFAFSTDIGTVSFTVSVPANNNLDAVLELQSATGTVLATAAPTTSFGASISYAIPAAGSYRILVKSQGNYGDVGQYTITGTVIPNTNSIATPSSLAATISGPGTVSLSWTDNATNETGYVVQRSADGGTNWSTLTTLAANSVAYVDSTGSAGATLSYRVQAINASGSSLFSNIAAVSFAPVAPVTLTATAASSSAINLSWSDVTGETGYKIFRSTDNITFTQVATTTANTTTYSGTGLASNTRYYYYVVATNAGGDSGRSVTASAVTAAAATVPTSPSNLTATATAPNSVALRWTDRSNNETGFYVERRTGNNGAYTRIATVGANATTYTDTTTVGGTRYTYRILSFNTAGVSTASRTASVTTPLASQPVGASLSSSGTSGVNPPSNGNGSSVLAINNNPAQSRTGGNSAVDSVFSSFGEDDEDDFWDSI